MCIGAAGATSLKAKQRSSSYTICAGISLRIILENMVSAELSAGGDTPVFVDKRQPSIPNSKYLLRAINGVRPTPAAARPGTTEYPICGIKFKVKGLIGIPKPLTQPTKVMLARYFAIPKFERTRNTLTRVFDRTSTPGRGRVANAFLKLLELGVDRDSPGPGLGTALPLSQVTAVVA